MLLSDLLLSIKNKTGKDKPYKVMAQIKAIIAFILMSLCAELHGYPFGDQEKEQADVNTIEMRLDDETLLESLIDELFEKC